MRPAYLNPDDYDIHYRGSEPDSYDDSSHLPEFKTPETIEDIRELPFSIDYKRSIRYRYLAEDEYSASQRSVITNSGWSKFLKRSRNRIKSFLRLFVLWRGSLKRIDSQFGTGTMLYFIFIKWLMFLNLIISIIMITFVIIPTLARPPENDKDCDSAANSSVACCTVEYFNTTDESNIAMDLIQGTGILEKTLLFYGYYENYIIRYNINNTDMSYNSPLAYIGVIIAYILLSLLLVLRGVTDGFKKLLIDGDYVYSNIVFGRWNFSIKSEKIARKKQSAIYKEIKNTFHSKVQDTIRKDNIKYRKKMVILIRVIVNLFVVIVLIACAVGISLVFEFSTESLAESNNINQYLGLFYQYLPSLTLVVLNMFVPVIFKKLIIFELYSPIYSVRLTLVRTVFLKLFSLFVLYASLYEEVSYERDVDECYNSNNPICWETYIGQQIYKLVVLDLIIHIFMTFIVNFIRSRIGKLNNKFAKIVGEQTFDLPKNVLDVVYLQTVSWFGSFFTPLLPIICTVILFITFYIKLVACLVNSKPSPITYGASGSKSMFMLVLLIAYASAIVPLFFLIGTLTPSKACGSFRGLNDFWKIVVHALNTLPEFLQSIAFFLSSPGFTIPLFLILFLTIYYYIAVISTNNKMIKNIKLQKKQSHDKKYLDRVFKQLMRQGRVASYN